MKRLIITLLVLVTIVIAFFILVDNNSKVDVSKYAGDGTIKDISWTFIKVMPIKGYEVQFETFALDSAYEQEYSFEGLPFIKGQNIVVYFVIDETPNYSQNNDTLQEEISMSLKSDNSNLIEMNAKLSELIAMNNHHFYGMGNGHNSIFQIQKTNAPFTFRVKYKPAGSLDNKKGYFLIQCGGSV